MPRRHGKQPESEDAHKMCPDERKRSPTSDLTPPAKNKSKSDEPLSAGMASMSLSKNGDQPAAPEGKMKPKALNFEDDAADDAAADAADLPEPDPRAKQPFTSAHLAAIAAVPLLYYICKEYNAFRAEVEEFLPDDRDDVYWILPCIPFQFAAYLEGKKIPIIWLHYSPTEIHVNAIHHENCASAEDENEQLHSGTWYLVQQFTGFFLYSIAVKGDSVPMSFWYGTDPTTIFEEEVWAKVEERYNIFMRKIMSHEHAIVLLGSKATVKRVNKAFGGKLHKKHAAGDVCMVSTDTKSVKTVVHPEKLHNKKIRGPGFGVNCAAYDRVYTLFGRMVFGPEFEACTAGAQYAINKHAALGLITQVDFVQFLIESYDSDLPYNHSAVPRKVTAYGRNHETAIRVRIGLADTETMLLLHLHGFMSYRGGQARANMAKEAHAFLNKAVGDGEHWEDAVDALAEESSRLLKVYQARRLDTFTEEREAILEYAEENPERVMEVGEEKSVVVVPKKHELYEHIYNTLRTLLPEDWRRIAWEKEGFYWCEYGDASEMHQDAVTEKELAEKKKKAGHTEKSAAALGEIKAKPKSNNGSWADEYY